MGQPVQSAWPLQGRARRPGRARADVTRVGPLRVMESRPWQAGGRGNGAPRERSR